MIYSEFSQIHNTVLVRTVIGAEMFRFSKYSDFENNFPKVRKLGVFPNQRDIFQRLLYLELPPEIEIFPDIASGT